MKMLPLCTAVVLGATITANYAQELPADAAKPAAAEAPAKVDPEAAAASVSKALKSTTDVPASAITVATHAGTVVLSGDVDTEAQRSVAQSVAEKAAGGVRVSSNIQVRPPEDRSPKVQLAAQQSTQLVRDVETALKADPRTANLGIAVSSADGKALVLQGLVPTRENRTAVQNVVSRVKGVTQVDNRLLIPGDPVPAAARP